MKRLALCVSIALATAAVVITTAQASTITVPSNPLWTDSGIVLVPQKTVVVSNAHGAWNWGFAPSGFGPEGDPRPDLSGDEWIANGQHGQLIGFVGSDPFSAVQNDPRLFAIGTSTVVLSGKSGKLWLGFNDDFVTNAIGDNAGSVSVAVQGVSGEPNSAHLQIAGVGGEATLSAGQCVTLAFEVRFTGSQQYVDVTSDSNTTYFTDPAHGGFTGNVFCARSGDANKTFAVYGRYRDPNSKVFVTGTVIIHVRR